MYSWKTLSPFVMAGGNTEGTNGRVIIIVFPPATSYVLKRYSDYS